VASEARKTRQRALRPELVLGILTVLVQGCRGHASDPPRASSLNGCAEWLITHAQLYVSPDQEVVPDATIRIRDGRFVEVKAGATEHPVPAGCTIDAGGRVATAGFWNAHVHHIDPALASEETAGPRLSEMFLSRGFTSVVDMGARPNVPSRLRQAITAGRVVGPRIVVFGGGFVYKDGTPSYLPKGTLPEIHEVAEAAPAVNAVLDAGANGIKIFSGSFQTPTSSKYLPPEIIEAVTQSAHARGVYVATHPTDRQSLLAAVDNGVDVVAHTVPPAGKLEPDLLERMHTRKIALIPTIKLWSWELAHHNVPRSIIDSFVETSVGQLRDYHDLGGEILFGTDAGYMTDFDTTDEFRAMARAGLDFRAILASLTIAPAQRFAGPTATVSVGNEADLVILESDPRSDVTAFARPMMTIRAGHVVYTKP
jgi:imidazolonepropionase-like amidohydrolase